MLIGNRAKTSALQQVFSIKRNWQLGSRRATNKIYLHSDPSTIFFQTPVFIAEGDIKCQDFRERPFASKYHELTRRAVHRTNADTSLDQVWSRLFTDLLYPFVDTFCFFCDDLGGLDSVTPIVGAWLQRGHSSTLPRSTLPRLILVTQALHPSTEREIDARQKFLELLKQETPEDIFEQVSAIEVIALFPSGSLSTRSRHRLLRERLMDRSDRVRQSRENSRVLFTTRHFTTFLKAACENFANNTNKFDFIQSSRVHNSVAVNLEEHLSNFLKYIKSTDKLIDFAAPIIASSLLLDNYPPDAHCKFSSII